MKIYFTASARGKMLYDSNYKRIYEIIEELGNKNLDDLILKIDPQKFYSGNKDNRVDLYKRTVKLIKNADIVILEVSVSSLSMGYVMDRALEEGKPVILLYFKGVNPYFAGGIQDERLQVVSYSMETLKEVLNDAIEEAKERMDVRFNFFVPPKIVSYLDWVSKHRKIPRAVYLRRLIEVDMKRNKDYKGS